ncbi:hypothetical protein RL72_01598 [Microbacterium azadirachtae]|uniref:Uncharacterized protein n=1 Tax=Microbacterium azadirachtae TaxID=582680 RepID=A0A0F0KXQ4_9MICO|nr:hypothetical protein [Microbacterium azadirachtae]KJL24875.1 hypothetical protein RL72_01598 [Microbacterium azadirachtae]
MSNGAHAEPAPTVWITRAEAGQIAPGLTPQRLDYLRREAPYPSKITAPPARVLSDGEVIYDELALRRWLESTVSWEWRYGHFGAYRPPPSEDRAYAFQNADLATLRRRTYVTESRLLELIPDLPLWRIRDLRFRAVGPRFLKPSHRTVIYIEEEALDWASGVSDYSDPIPDRVGRTGQPYTPVVRRLP